MPPSIYSSLTSRVHARGRDNSSNGLLPPYPRFPAHRQSTRSPWWIRIFVFIVMCSTTIFHPRRFYQYTTSRFGRKRGSYVLCVSYVSLIFGLYALAHRFGSPSGQWPTLFSSSTLVYKLEDLQRIWKWEIASGHYPSRRESKNSQPASPFFSRLT
jgi:hypothetical protein